MICAFDGGRAANDRFGGESDEFPGTDMARKYLRMGDTREIRSARYPGSRKYDDGDEREPRRSSSRSTGSASTRTRPISG